MCASACNCAPELFLFKLAARQTQQKMSLPDKDRVYLIHAKAAKNLAADNFFTVFGATRREEKFWQRNPS
jgi:hypothetical protein